MERQRKIALLGATGSIGRQTLDVVRKQPGLSIVSMAAGRNISLLEEAAREFHPKVVAVYDEAEAKRLKERLNDTDVSVVSGMDGLVEAACVAEADVTLGAVVGMIGIRPTVEAIKAGKDIAIANKETLVTAGHLILPLVKEKKVKLLPVDSEHSAIFQSLHGEEGNAVSRILLTASGGPFYGKTKADLQSVTVQDALKHPNWSMGRKITVDSATLVNKGLEVMEAYWLFSVPYDRIEVVIQPESVIHSMVEFEDGAVMAELGVPDMRTAIQYALTYPKREKLGVGRLDFDTLRSIRFGRPDTDAFPGLAYAYEAGRKGGNLPTVFNAANEYAVALFLDGRIRFTEIPELIRFAMDHVRFREAPSLDEVLETERETIEVLSCHRS
ncbi:MAG: 1-deoxy-D-xylulose-5-phosphate reductoisomerase [Lachnospiraceae bacterium]|nr:1-deoxy-D-xylulose-5-phosphate reductoisomerase [Lachnospiraceae bacterium]